MTQPKTSVLPRISEPSDSASLRALEESLEDASLLGKGSLEEQNQKFQDNVREESISALAEKLPPVSLGVGFHSHYHTFPMRSADGDIVGFRQRFLKEGKGTIAGGKVGLFIPEGVTAANAQVICEGESCTAAALTLGVEGIGRASAGTCAGMVVRFFETCCVACPTIIGDNDDAGRKGAETQAETLIEGGVPCRLLFPPSDYSDLREWAHKGALTREELVKAIEAQPIRFTRNDPPGFTMLPNRLVRIGVVAKIGVGPFALACAIMSFKGGNGKIHPTRAKLAELLGVLESTVDRYKTTLMKAGILTWQRGRPTWANEYQVNFGPLKGQK
jgi:hypothetical protein